MTAIDIALVGIIVWGGYNGYKAGFLMSLLSFIAITLGVLVGFKLMGMAMILLAEKFNVDHVVLPYIAFSIVFICIVIGIIWMGRMIKASMDKNFLGTVDQISGALFGVLKTAFMISVLIWIVNALKIHKIDALTAHAIVYKKLSIIFPAVSTYMGKHIPFFRDVFNL